MATGKVRLDQLLVQRGLCVSREKARAAIMAGAVLVAGERAAKPGQLVAAEAAVELVGQDSPFVSRGGLKLAHALAVFDIDLAGRVVLDAGASTGGFTDCALQRGAKSVHAVDVGYGQLDWRLRQDPRVHVRERTNLRYLEPEVLGEAIDLATLDLSFISLAKIWPALLRLLAPAGEVLALVKPQFEAGRERLGKKGVVRDPHTHAAILAEVLAEAQAQGLAVLGLTYSPIAGPEGNLEFLAHLRRGPSPDALTTEALAQRVAAVVDEAWQRVKRKTAPQVE